MILNCHTYYSLGYGALSQEALLEELRSKKYTSFASTDINNVSNALNMVQKAKEYNLHYALGIDFRNKIKQVYVGIALNNHGFKELNSFLSNHLHEEKEFPVQAPILKDVVFIYPYPKSPKKLNENEFIGVSRHQINQWAYKSSGAEKSKSILLESLSFRNKSDYNAHRLLRAIHSNKLLSQMEEKDLGLEQETIVPKEVLLTQLGEYSFLADRAESLIQNCSYDFALGQNKNKKHFYKNEDEDFQKIRALCEHALSKRYPNINSVITDRLEKELSVIKELHFCSYFLINHDIIQYAKSKNYPYVGRGSGANSIVAYLLEITDVDPVELDLFFERFINKYRSSPPDFDIDFNWTDRDDITKYIFDKYGHDRVALLGTYNTLQYRATIREIGKAMGIPSLEIKELQKGLHVAPKEQMAKAVLKYSSMIHQFPNHLSIHSSGIIISDKSLYNYTSTFLPPKGFPTAQFSMLEAEDVGLHKFDILSQRGLGKIMGAVQLVKDNQGIEVDIHDIPAFKKDKKIEQVLKKGETIGCFYVESPAMRMLLTKLEATTYKDLVAASSIIRPGVAKSGMMREYILRFRDAERRKKAEQDLPELYQILKDTYGVMVYQEDVIKVAHIFAGIGLAEADVLRKGMSWKFKKKNEFEKIKQQFFDNCAAKGYNQKVRQEIWLQIESFGNYAFAKGHSASYAVESYQAMFLKAYYPIEYMVATLNNGGGYYNPEVYVHEAKKHGAIIHPPHLNKSNLEVVLEGKNVYLGFGMIRELENTFVRKIIKERNKNGEFIDLRNLLDRVACSLEQIVLLIKVGALDFLNVQRQKLLWDAHFMLSKEGTKGEEVNLFRVQPKTFELPELEEIPEQRALDELELLGFSLDSPFNWVKIPDNHTLCAKDLSKKIDHKVAIIGYLIHVKITETSNGQRMYFGTFLDQEGAWLDTVHFPNVAQKNPPKGRGCYLIKGKVCEEFGFISIEADFIEKLEFRR